MGPRRERQRSAIALARFRKCAEPRTGGGVALKRRRIVAVGIVLVVAWLAAWPAEAAWYLLTPPADKDDNINVRAPLSQWDQNAAYDTAQVCEQQRNFFIIMSHKEARRDKGTQSERASDYISRTMLFSLCVASDDPRLAAAPSPAPSSEKKSPLGFQNLLDQETLGLPKAAGVIHYTPGRPIVVTVRLNGRSSARLVLDTGADRSMIRSRSLIAAGVDLARPVARGKVRGVAGETEVSYFNVDSMEVGSARVRSLKVAAYDIDESASDGLLGRDFLDGFNVSIDPAAGIIRLTPR